MKATVSVDVDKIDDVQLETSFPDALLHKLKICKSIQIPTGFLTVWRVLLLLSGFFTVGLHVFDG